MHRKCLNHRLHPTNKPGGEPQYRMINLYKSIEKAIRVVHPHQLLFLEDVLLDGFSHLSKAQEVFPNTLFAIHYYSLMDFPIGESYIGGKMQDAIMESDARKGEFHTSMNKPVWNGEVRLLHTNPKYEPDLEAINAQRYALLGGRSRFSPTKRRYRR